MKNEIENPRPACVGCMYNDNDVECTNPDSPIMLNIPILTCDGFKSSRPEDLSAEEWIKRLTGRRPRRKN